MTHPATLQDQFPTNTGHATCLFCRFDDKTVNKILLQSANFYARLDNFPAAVGHLEIVPKRHVVSYFELTPAEASEAYELISAAQCELSRLYNPEGYTIGINEGRVAGRSIDHLHIHLIPRYQGDVEDPSGGIRQILPNCDPKLWASAD
jgi:diadenosine tetraphosphate (Ap4A) HIT family hydrolase